MIHMETPRHRSIGTERDMCRLTKVHKDRNRWDRNRCIETKRAAERQTATHKQQHTQKKRGSETKTPI